MSGGMAPARRKALALPELGLKLPPYEAVNGSFVKAVLAEFVCVTAFLFITIGHVTFSCHASNVGLGVVNGTVIGSEVGSPSSCALTDARLLSIATVFGLSIGALVYASAAYSGGHLNPAVTLGFLVARKITLQRAFCYWIAQLAGAILGSLFPFLIDRVAWHAARGATNSNTAVEGMHDSAVWAMEALLTGVLMFVVMAATDARKAKLEAHIPVLAPFAIGFAVFICHLVAVPIDGCSINPARSFGPAVISGIWTDQWIFWVGPFCGGILGAVIYECFFRLTRSKDDKLPSGDGKTQQGSSVGNGGPQHLPDFSGEIGHGDHDHPSPSEMLLPAYMGYKGAGSGRPHGRNAHEHTSRTAANSTAAQPAVPSPEASGHGTVEPTPHSFRGQPAIEAV